MKKIFLLAVILLFISILLYSQEDQKKFSVLPDNIVDISIEGGVGLYVGKFLDHLRNSGAYTLTPDLDLYVSLYFIKYFGIQAMLGSGCIIHKYSYPIEGTILYMALELFGQYDWKYAYMRMFAGAGFQHTTMLIQWYASGFFEGGLSAGIKITDWLYLNNSVKFRTGFLHSVIIKYKYDIPENDTLMSVTVSTGVVFKIKNPNIKS
jgi:hypothetical protein